MLTNAPALVLLRVPGMSIFTKRLKEMRTAAGLSQERLGISAGIDPASARARVNQYENGKHHPDQLTVRNLALVLDAPESYFYAVDEDTARLLLLFHRLPQAKRAEVLGLAEALSKP